MNKRTRSLTLTVAAAILTVASTAPLHAQGGGGGTGAFKWYVGAHGGLQSFRTNIQDRQFIPAAGAHMLITAKRTGVLLSVDQSFGGTELAVSNYRFIDSLGQVIEQGTIQNTFKGFRKYTAALLAFPVRNRSVQPFIGVGAGVMHTVSHFAGGYWADGAVENELGSTGFGTGIGGIEFRVGKLSAFGMWQVTTKSGYKEIGRVVRVNTEGEPVVWRYDYGEIMRGANHTFVGGLRFSLGSSREDFTSVDEN